MSFRKFLRSFVISAVALYLTTKIIPGFVIAQGIGNLLFATLALSVLNLTLRPIIRLFLLPINLVTLGAFRWLSTIITLYILTWIIPEVNINSFPLSDIPTIGILLPSIVLGKFFATITTALTTTFIHRLLLWLTKS